MNKRGLIVLFSILLLVASLVAFTSIGSLAQPTTGSEWVAQLSGFQEVSPKLTDATGTFRATLSGDQLTYQLTFGPTIGTVNSVQIAFGQPAVSGSALVFLCGTGTGKPGCPANGGTLTGTITSADVQSAKDQNVSSGDFGALVRIIQAGAAYVNVQTTKFTDGETRGQIMLSPAATQPTMAAPTAETMPTVAPVPTLAPAPTTVPAGAATVAPGPTEMGTPASR